MSRRTRILWIITFTWWAILFTATHVPKLPPIAATVSDKIEHVVSYGILALLLNLSLRASKSRKNIAMTVLLTLMVYGAIDEWLQALPFIHRSCEFLDWCADVAGTSIAVMMVWLTLGEGVADDPTGFDVLPPQNSNREESSP